MQPPTQITRAHTFIISLICSPGLLCYALPVQRLPGLLSRLIWGCQLTPIVLWTCLITVSQFTPTESSDLPHNISTICIPGTSSSRCQRLAHSYHLICAAKFHSCLFPKNNITYLLSSGSVLSLHRSFSVYIFFPLISYPLTELSLYQSVYVGVFRLLSQNRKHKPWLSYSYPYSES